jgi:hypothetical protein
MAEASNVAIARARFGINGIRIGTIRSNAARRIALT